MKPSIFNSLINLTENSELIYNSFSDSFFVVRKTMINLFTDPQKIKDIYPKLYKEFVKTGIYVNKDIDEMYRLRDLYKTIATNKKSFFLMINPTLGCNFRCWYCYESHLDKSEMSPKTLIVVKRFISKVLDSSIESFTLSFFGGEPFLKYKTIVLPLVSFTAKECQKKNKMFSVSFTSNGSLITSQKVHELIQYAPLSLQITLDGNRNIHNSVRYFKNKNGSYDIIIKNLLILISQGCNVRLRINYTKETLETIKDIIIDLNLIPYNLRKFLIVDFHRVWQDKDSMDILPNLRAIARIFRLNGFEVIYNSLNEIRNCCYADKINTAIINYNGDVFKCSAQDFTSNNKNGVLNENGSIIWKNSPYSRLLLKLKNKSCQNCRIAPLCGGGCTNFILSHSNINYCLYNRDDSMMDKLILDRFETFINK